MKKNSLNFSQKLANLDMNNIYEKTYLVNTKKNGLVIKSAETLYQAVLLLKEIYNNTYFLPEKQMSFKEFAEDYQFISHEEMEKSIKAHGPSSKIIFVKVNLFEGQ